MDSEELYVRSSEWRQCDGPGAGVTFDELTMSKSDDAKEPDVEVVSKKKRIERRATAIDAFVGSRVRERRLLLGYSLEELASRIGVGAQQLQKYETGANRISASRLYDMTNALGVPIGWVFAGVDGSPAQKKIEPPAGFVEQISELVGIFGAIEEPESRQKLIELARILSNTAKKL